MKVFASDTRVRFIGTALVGTVQRFTLHPHGLVLDVEWDNGTRTSTHEDKLHPLT